MTIVFYLTIEDSQLFLNYLNDFILLNESDLNRNHSVGALSLNPIRFCFS